MKLNELWGVKKHLQHSETSPQVENVLRKHGFEPLGSGATGSVWQIPSKPYVLKIFDNRDTAYLEFVEMCKHSNNNPHFPFFRGVPVALTPEVSALRMERLTPIRVNWASATQQGLRVMMEALPLGSEWQEEVMSEFSAAERRDLNLALRKWPRLAEAGHNLVQLHSKSEVAHWDLHLDNVMFRGSTPVFTDPFSV